MSTRRFLATATAAAALALAALPGTASAAPSGPCTIDEGPAGQYISNVAQTEGHSRYNHPGTFVAEECNPVFGYSG